MKTKIFAYICVFALVLSLLVVPSFAFDNDFTGEFVFKDNISFDVGFPSDIDMYFNCDGVLYWQIQITSEPGTGGTSPIIVYRDNANNEDLIVYIDGQWVDDSYRYLSFVGGGDLSPEALAFMNANEYIPPSYSGWYYDIYDMLHNAVFDGNELNGAQDLVLTLLSIVFCCAAISIPILVVLAFIKFVLSMRFF